MNNNGLFQCQSQFESEYSLSPIFVLDIETPGHGKNLDRNHMIAFAAIIIEPELFNSPEIKNYLMNKRPLTIDQIQHLVPESQRFSMYIHDVEALKQIHPYMNNILNSSNDENKIISTPGPIWEEVKGREFWLDDKNRAMLIHAINEMTSSPCDEKSAMQLFERWFQEMMKKFPKLLFVSDTSNFDYPWLDHYRKKFLNLDSINHATKNGFVLPVDTGSFYYGLTAYRPSTKLNFNSWDNFNDQIELTSAGYSLPNLELVLGNDHQPLNDVLKIGLRFASILFQHKYTRTFIC